ncbi:F-box/FBD/LRR-repeat protein At1g16930-like [Vigna unguiculata]|uniref:F-box/FBD/LRR-repeat protein At1g16930-like n=1 Tax=Vigna unguiculata TaxID=3917 RepID=UPI001016D123|nr:F-box/FBD/LRR-repeat protein At1g16930-like [Vigna unguiculata]
MADRISSLPDSILCDILSSLPTKEVVATSVLSKRWIFLWRSVPSFHFDYNHDKYKEACTHFLQSVDSFLLSRDREQPLHRFRLTFDSTLDQTICIKTWITAAVSGRVQHLDINCNRDIVMPSVFSCKTLVVLKLNSITVEDFSSVDLPLLKILYLNSVSLPRYLDLSQILSGCPNLEDLEVMGLACETKGKFNRLTKLVRASINENLLPLEIVKDVEVLLLNWVYQRNLDLDFDFQNLVQLELDLQANEDWLWVLKLLKHCPNLQSLVICIYKEALENMLGHIHKVFRHAFHHTLKHVVLKGTVVL